MKVTPLDLRQTQFATGMRGYDRNEVRSFLADAADDYEQALREIDRLRQDLSRAEHDLVEHRDREINLRNTLLTAQRLADQIRENAENEAKMILREVEGRADLAIQKAQARLEEIERDIAELKLRRRDVETSLDSSIAAMTNALEHIRSRAREEKDDKLLLHRPRQAPQPAAAGETAIPAPPKSAGADV